LFDCAQAREIIINYKTKFGKDAGPFDKPVKEVTLLGNKEKLKWKYRGKREPIIYRPEKNAPLIMLFCFKIQD